MLLGYLIAALVLWGMYRIAHRIALACAQRQLDRGFVPRPLQVAPPPRMMLAYRELPTAVLATLAGRRTRARLRLIVAYRRDQSMERYYERLGELLPIEDPAGGRPLPVVHLDGIVTEHWRRRWEHLGFRVRFPEVGHPIGSVCFQCADVPEPRVELCAAPALVWLDDDRQLP